MYLGNFIDKIKAVTGGTVDKDPIPTQKPKPKKNTKPIAESKSKKPKGDNLSPKEIATRRGEPWVDVVAFHINKDNIRNGFYDIDWNELFVIKLRNEGYGYNGDPDEEVVNRWFRDICYNVAASDDGFKFDPDSVGSTDFSKIFKD